MLILACEPQELWRPLKCLNDSSHYRSCCFHMQHFLASSCAHSTGLWFDFCSHHWFCGTGTVWGEEREQCSSKLHNLGNYFFHKVLWFTKAWEFPQSLLVTGRVGGWSPASASS